MLEPGLRAHFDYVTKTLGDDPRGRRTIPLNQGIGRQRGAVDDLADLFRRNPSRVVQTCTTPSRIAASDAAWVVSTLAEVT